MTPSMDVAVAVILAYLLGSLSFAVIVSRGFGLEDPRTYGSKNPGATNVLRSGHRGAAALTLLFDGLKGWVAVWAAARFGVNYGIDDDGVALVAVAVFLGHLYPLYFRFQGGKGVATALGVVFALQPVIGLFACATWLIIAVFFRYSSLASLAALIFAPLFYMLWVGADVSAAALWVITLFVIYRHRNNIANLLAGRESRIGEQKTR